MTISSHCFATSHAWNKFISKLLRLLVYRCSKSLPLLSNNICYKQSSLPIMISKEINNNRCIIPSLPNTDTLILYSLSTTTRETVPDASRRTPTKSGFAVAPKFEGLFFGFTPPPNVFRLHLFFLISTAPAATFSSPSVVWNRS